MKYVSALCSETKLVLLDALADWYHCNALLLSSPIYIKLEKT